jgi:hypothetical protein
MRNYVAYAVVFGLLACSSSAVLLVAQESSRTIPCLIARLRSPDFTIDDQEIVIALNLWIAQSRVGSEIPQPISDEMMIKIIDLWVRGADCRGAL